MAPYRYGLACPAAALMTRALKPGCAAPHNTKLPEPIAEATRGPARLRHATQHGHVGQDHARQVFVLEGTRLDWHRFRNACTHSQACRRMNGHEQACLWRPIGLGGTNNHKTVHSGFKPISCPLTCLASHHWLHTGFILVQIWYR